ncbi:N,N-dimethylformamidase beta subunit family domain-containing protein [Actinokineospora fastidiosa]|uniref:Large subunit of N,N-dimethylformamidase n=1 Tax=Actinokineospora fastidiosa TaxID=1816 RepID=A0A918LDD8_9PSEU|nr:N,N-dimethylformamidase beta subunit family domain-containing protein [Actinokineospora fastidiosa]GGS32663.1 large subunit of N,N-dimethylformamidase [Actinokineospora fastidiosa]
MARVDHTHAPVVGYTDRLSARPGERIAVSASSVDGTARVRVLRVGHDGTAPVHTVLDWGTPETVDVPHQVFDHGSYGEVPRPPDLGAAGTFAVWVWPTALPADRAGLLSQGDAASGPHAELALRADGRPEYTVRTTGGLVSVAGPVLHLRRWYRLVGSHGPDGLRLETRPRDRVAGEDPSAVSTADGGPAVIGAAPLLLAARRVGGERVGHFDGKLDAPTVFDRVETAPRLDERGGARSHWDLSADIAGDRMLDVIDGRHGTLRNHPLRGVTGHDWDGDVLDWRFAAQGYGAVHFHSDDLSDCGWPPVLTVALPADAPTGCYAVELATDSGVDRLPFFVRPTRRRAEVALLIPTLSYLAYALDHLYQPFAQEDPREVAAPFARDNTLHSLYDRHTDGSGVAVASLRRPLLGMREDHVFRYTRSPHQYSEDLHLVGWLARQGVDVDVLTDHDLHAEPGLLDGYRAVLTGSHPEYWTTAMMDAAHAYLDGGGNLAYLGGNGAYWVTGIAPGREHLAELRRGYSGVRTWECEPGELTLACTGEPGGLWAERGRSPHRLFGIGTSAAGMSTGGSYTDLADHPLLAGVTEPLGDYGAVLGGAASFETDGIDPLLGSPPNVELLGRAMLGDTYMSGDTGPAIPHPLGDPVDRRRADLTLYRHPGGGEVFATGSIGWCAALTHAADDNDVSRVTAAVLRRFTGPNGGNHATAP